MVRICRLVLQRNFMCGQLLQNHECLANVVLLTSKVEYANAKKALLFHTPLHNNPVSIEYPEERIQNPHLQILSDCQ